jgi:hypothetical protein
LITSCAPGDRLLALLAQTPVSEEVRGRIHTDIAKDFGV